VAKLPLGPHAFYAGVDAGFKGAVALMNADGTSIKTWDMPVCPYKKERQREIDLAKLWEIFTHLRSIPDCVVGIEWPSTRVGEGAERSERFGRQKGILHAFAHAKGLEYYLISPQLWKGRLGVPGKTHSNANKIGADLFRTYYPEAAAMIAGPRGGILDGRLDALLIAHFLRTRSFSGMKTVADKFGKDSLEAQAHILMMGKQGRRRLRLPSE
jgi:hypothetical protein